MGTEFTGFDYRIEYQVQDLSIFQKAKE